MSTILVTGGCTGLGATITCTLRAAGHDVLTHSHTRKDPANFVLDFSTLTSQEADALIDTVRPDVLVNNAGTTHLGFNEDFPMDEWDRIYAVNLKAPFLLSRSMMRVYGKAATNKTIINIVSMASKGVLRTSAAYCTSKAALAHLTRQMAREAADRFPGFVFYGISPQGMEGTEMYRTGRDSLETMRGMTPEQADKYSIQSPLGRLERRDEVACCVKFLVESRPEYMTGTNIEHTGAGP